VSLNVAVNSHNNVMLTLLVSNNFVELKSNVFKRFEPENLFVLSCSDMVERFQVRARGSERRGGSDRAGALRSAVLPPVWVAGMSVDLAGSHVRVRADARTRAAPCAPRLADARPTRPPACLRVARARS
jgi:hypothetical protein